jgi:two-component system cell cycle sensor histidine kinase/response regulator CckA
MGLASAYGTIKTHNGAIEVYTEPGKGTTFKIYLPLADEQARRITETGTIITKRSGTVLLIDDEPIMREVGSEMLADLGYTVAVCEDGKQGVEQYQQHQHEIDFVILDIMMPNLDGYSCFRELKKIKPDVCVIIASGYSINGMATDLMTEGAKAFIQKPFDAVRLSKAIDKAQLP